MARASQTSQPLVQAGVQMTLTAPSASPNGDIVDTGAVFLLVNNTDSAPVTVTVTATATVSALPVDDLVVSVPAGKIKLIGPLRPDVFGQAVGSADAGRAYVDYTTSGSLAAVLRGVVSYR